MQVLKYGLFLVIGIAAQACGSDSGDSGGGDDEEGGTTGNGGSSSGTTGKGGSSSGTTGTGGSSSGTTGNGGSSSGTTGNGGSSSGTTGNGGSSSGTTGNGGTAGTGGACTGGTVNIYDSPECQAFFECVFDSACAQAGASQQICIDILKTAFASTVAACVPTADAATACDAAKADPSVGMTYPQCVD